MLAMYGYAPLAKAASFDSAKDTISDSAPGATNVLHTFTIDLGTQLGATDVLRVTFQSEFSNVNGVCPSGGTASTTGDILDCTGVIVASSTPVTFYASTTNPSSPGSYTVDLQTRNSSGTEIENAQVRVYIIDEVTVTATVNANLTFTVSGTTTGAVINGDATDVDTSSTSIAFGDLVSETQKVAGHTLSVSTNADDGFSVTVEQDHNLRTAAGADIDSFSTSTEADWVSPTPNLSDESSWGYMGVASDDDTLFTSGFYQGLDGTNPLTIFSHNDPADGVTQNAGRAHVAYSIEISDVQEAGDYSNTLTYICTPTY